MNISSSCRQRGNGKAPLAKKRLQSIQQARIQSKENSRNNMIKINPRGISAVWGLIVFNTKHPLFFDVSFVELGFFLLLCNKVSN